MKNRHVQIKQNLIEHFDYVVVTPDVWAYLKAWYDYDFAVLRFVKRDAMQGKLYLEVYPEDQSKSEPVKKQLGHVRNRESQPLTSGGRAATSYEDQDSGREHWQKLLERNEEQAPLQPPLMFSTNVASKKQLMPPKQ